MQSQCFEHDDGSGIIFYIRLNKLLQQYKKCVEVNGKWVEKQCIYTDIDN